MTRLIGRLAATMLLAATALMLSPSPALAQNEPAADPPGRVARLSEFSGQVWLYSPDTGEWIGAVRNQPVSTGDRLATDRDGRVELQVGSTTLRLDSNSELEVSALDDERMQLQLENGSAYVRVPDLANTGALELTTDEGRFIVQRNGNYRFDREGSTSRITVYGGGARYEGQNSGLPVTAGQRAEFWIDSGGVAQYTLSAPVSDSFSAWNNDRDRREPTGGTALRYVSPEMTGAEDLDRYGRWEQSPDYGPLWVPTAVAVDWAPYRTGHWAWVSPWGWTWIDDAPWGFAPFHYGRWVYVRNSWCWAPGNRVVRPVYAPALVAWMGSSHGGVSVRVGGGPAVGWFPLAPREVYVPSYRVSSRYARDVNIGHVTNVTVINNVFANPQARRDFDNRRWPGAVTVVPAGVMSGRQPVAPAAAQMRNNPQARELFAAQQPGRGPAPSIAPPVAAPPPVRAVDPRAVRPPGFAERPASPRPGFAAGQQDRDRDGRGRDVGRPESQRPPMVGQQPGNPNTPIVNAQPRPPAPVQQPAVPQPNVVQTTPAVPGAPQVQPQPNPRVGSRPPPPFEAGGEHRRPRGERGDAAPAAPQVAQPAPVQQQGPMMRAQPVHRDDRREGVPPPPVERPAPSVAPAPAPAVQPPRAVEMQRPQPQMPPRAVEVQRPQPPQMSQRPVEVQHPQPPQMPQRPVEVQRPAAPVHPAPPQAVAPPPQPAPQPEMRRPEPQRREPAEQKRGDRDTQR